MNRMSGQKLLTARLPNAASFYAHIDEQLIGKKHEGIESDTHTHKSHKKLNMHTNKTVIGRKIF